MRLISSIVAAGIVGLFVLRVIPDPFYDPRRAKHVEARNALERLAIEVERYQADLGELPESLENLIFTMQVQGWNGPYVQSSLLVDPWGKPFEYEKLSNQSFRISTLGEDEAFGGVGKNKDQRVER